MDLELILIGLFALFGSLFFILFLVCFHRALQPEEDGTHITINLGDEELAQDSCIASSRDAADDSIFLMTGTTSHNFPPPAKSALAACQYSSNLHFMKRLSRSLTAERSALIMPCIIREFSVAEIEAATTKFSSSKVIKHGHSGDIFEGVLEGGEVVVIKRVKCTHKSTRNHCSKDGNLDNNYMLNNISIQKDYYAAEMDVYGKVLDQTFLVPVLGQCLASQEEKFLVYEYMPYGDLASILAKARAANNYMAMKKAEKQAQLTIVGKAEKEQLAADDGMITTPTNALDGGGANILTWPVRMRIAREVAEALVYLHHESRPPLSHRNIQGSSILFNKDFEVKLGSLGDAQKIESGELPVYDIYCFGRLLLDLISGLDISGNGRDEAVQAWISMCFHALKKTTTPPPPLPNYKKEAHNYNYYNMFTTELMDRSLVPLMQEHQLLEMIQVAQLAKLCMEPTTLQKLSMKGVLDLLPFSSNSGKMP